MMSAIARQLLQPLRVHRVDLDQPDALLVSQKLGHGFHIRPGGLKTNDNFFKVMGLGCRRDTLPELLKASPVVPKGKRFSFGAVGTTIISVMSVLSSVNRCDKNFFIDCPGIFWFNLFHGYAPFFGLDLPTPQLVPNQESEYSLFQQAWLLSTI
jgi:hypothetical protein